MILDFISSSFGWGAWCFIDSLDLVCNYHELLVGRIVWCRAGPVVTAYVGWMEGDAACNAVLSHSHNERHDEECEAKFCPD